jgi:hypothetical protein
MKVRGPALVAVVVSLIALLAPATTAADDASVYAAWTSRADETKQLSARWDTAFKRWTRSSLRDWKTMYDAGKAVARLALEIDRSYDGALRLIERAARYGRSATRYVRKARAEFRTIGIVPAARMATCRACDAPP